MFAMTPLEFIALSAGAVVALALPLDGIFWWLKRLVGLL
jgi:hypothetical protein